MFDVIVVGARVAGSPTAMLLARKGYKVLLLDRASFPSDTLSSHQVQIRGGVMLKKWGLWDQVLASNCPPARKVSFNAQPYCIQANYPVVDGVDAVVSPRRTILDKILVDAAADSGAELRQDFLVEELVLEDGRVTGVRGRRKAGGSTSETPIVEKARLVIGADGKHSLVAKIVQAPEYLAEPTLTCAYYSYWEGLAQEGGEMYSLPQGAVGVWPTNDGLSLIYTSYPAAEFQAVRADIEGRFWQTVEALPGLAGRVHAGRMAERFYGTADLPAFFRRPYGPGWALVGDAGMTMDPVSGQGIGNAFQDAQRMAEAVDAALSGRNTLETALEAYEKQRNAETLPLYQFTSQLAAFKPPQVEQRVLFAALEKNPQAASQFFGALSGAAPLPEFFAPANLFRIMGFSGMSRIFFSKAAASFGNRRQVSVQP